jgi:Domain of unknown function (DUF4382)
MRVSGNCNRLIHIGFLAASASLGACSGGSHDNPNGRLTLALIDAPTSDVAELWIEFTGVTLKPSGDGPAIDIDFEAPLDLNLLDLNADNAATLLDGHMVPAGAYNWIALKVSAEFDGTLDSYVVLQDGGVEEVRVPSGTQNGLRLVSGFTVTANQETSFIIDWNVRKGLVQPVGQPGYFLRPALRIVDMTEFATLTGTVDMSLVTDTSCTNDLNLDTGNAVYIFDGLDVVADDIDGIDPDPVATTAVTQDRNGEYAYKTLLSPGDYTLAFTCQADGDGPDDDDAITFVGTTNVTLADGEVRQVNF